ncbi:hypothetical protein ACFLTX_01445 [Chloroflexota bacterium]
MELISNKDLRYFKTGVAHLDDYLLANELFWNLPGLSMLTLGGLYLAEVHLQTTPLNDDERKIFTSTLQKMELISLKWRVAWEKKIRWEITSRLNLWQNYLADYWSAPEDHGEYYVREVRWRVMLQLLSDNLSGNYKERNILRVLDDRLRKSFIPGVFIWSSELSELLDDQSFWFLYGTLLVGVLRK